MAATRIRVRFTSVDVVRDADLFGPGEWFFGATIRRLPANVSTTAGNDTRFEAREGRTINMNWSEEVTIEAADRQVEIRLQGTDEDLIWDDDLGWVRILLNTPIVHDYDLRLRSNLGNYSARIQVEILERTADSTGTVTAIREHFASNHYSTIHDEMLSKMVHVCPVIPVPWSTGIPPIPRGVQSLSASPQVNLSINSSTSGFNALVNPSLIPVLNPSDTDFSNRCARIRATQYRPADLDLSKLIWKAATDNIRFWHGGAPRTEVRGGQEVRAYGVLRGSSDEECRIEVRWDSEGQPLLTTFRAWVGPIKYVWCRANIIKCSSTSVGGVPIQNPTYTAADVVNHIAFSNKILWQSGIQIVMDNDTHLYNGARRLQQGIFEISSSTNHTFNVTKDRRIVAPLLNSRDGIFNLAYIHSCRGRPGLLGSATDRRLSPAEGTENLGGSPSTSWIRPTGIWPDAGAGTVGMTRMGPSNARADDQRSICGDGAIARICACLMTENCKANITNGEVTLPHELGHVIGLHHRGSGGNQTRESYDGVNHMAGPRSGRGHPWDENLMSYGSDREAQDIDLIQTRVIRRHPLLKTAPPTATTPPSPPPTPPPQPIPAAYTPTEADVSLMQEYLCNARSGLSNTGYDLGSSGDTGNGVDGIYGSRTRTAVRAFQRDHGEGLVVDGVYGPNTRNAFDQEINVSS